MPDLSSLPLWPTTLIFLASALVIGIAGWRLSGVADELADRTGMGEVVAGALFVGAATSLPARSHLCRLRRRGPQTWLLAMPLVV